MRNGLDATGGLSGENAPGEAQAPLRRLAHNRAGATRKGNVLEKRIRRSVRTEQDDILSRSADNRASGRGYAHGTRHRDRARHVDPPRRKHHRAAAGRRGLAHQRLDPVRIIAFFPAGISTNRGIGENLAAGNVRLRKFNVALHAASCWMTQAHQQRRHAQLEILFVETLRRPAEYAFDAMLLMPRLRGPGGKFLLRKFAREIEQFLASRKRAGTSNTFDCDHLGQAAFAYCQQRRSGGVQRDVVQPIADAEHLVAFPGRRLYRRAERLHPLRRNDAHVVGNNRALSEIDRSASRNGTFRKEVQVGQVDACGDLDEGIRRDGRRREETAAADVHAIAMGIDGTTVVAEFAAIDEYQRGVRSLPNRSLRAIREGEQTVRTALGHVRRNVFAALAVLANQRPAVKRESRIRRAPKTAVHDSRRRYVAVARPLAQLSTSAGESETFDIHAERLGEEERILVRRLVHNDRFAAAQRGGAVEHHRSGNFVATTRKTYFAHRSIEQHTYLVLGEVVEPSIFARRAGDRIGGPLERGRIVVNAIANGAEILDINSRKNRGG